MASRTGAAASYKAFRFADARSVPAPPVSESTSGSFEFCDGSIPAAAEAASTNLSRRISARFAAKSAFDATALKASAVDLTASVDSFSASAAFLVSLARSAVFDADSLIAVACDTSCSPIRFRSLTCSSFSPFSWVRTTLNSSPTLRISNVSNRCWASIFPSSISLRNSVW